MILSDVMKRIIFKTGSTDDITNHNANALISNSNILYELNAQLINYANKTKGIQDFYSYPVTSNNQWINAPSLALRSEAYRSAYLITRGWINPLDIRNARDIYNIFRVTPIKSVGAWLLIVNEINQQRILFFPMSGTTYNTTTLTAGISANATTIPVTSAGSFIATGGRIDIDGETIMYQYKDATNFYGCVRGLEMTTAAAHLISATVNEHNLIMNYSRLPQALTITDNPTSGQLAASMEVVDDHMEGIILITSANLLVKVDPQRAAVYRAEGDALLEQYKLDIGKGYSKMRSGVGVRQPYLSESGIPMNGNRW